MGRINIYTGPAGSGKTYHAINDFLSSASKGDVLFPDRHSFLIVPEQLTVEIENKLLTAAGSGGLIASEVISFNRLIYKILAESNKKTGIPLTPSMRAMLLVKVLKNNERKLSYFKKTQEKPFAVAKLGSTITELEKYLVEPETLENAANKYESEHQEDELTVKKLRDIALVKRAFTSEIKGKYEDAQLLAGDAIELINSGTTFITGSSVFVDSFSGFTKVELEILKAISLQCDNLSVYCFKPDYQSSFFGCPLDTLKTLEELLNSTGNVVNVKSILSGDPAENDAHSRFSGSPELRHLSKSYGKIARRDEILLHNKGKEHDIVFAAEGDFYHELEAASNYIEKLVSSGNYGWSDIAVAIPSLDTKQYIASAVFAGRNIPTFIDARLERSGHPLIRLADAFMRICAGELNKNTLTTLLRTGLVNINGETVSRDDADVLENAFLASNVASEKSFRKCVERLAKKYADTPDLKPSYVLAAEALFALLCDEKTGLIYTARGARTVSDALNVFLEFAARCGIDDSFSVLSEKNGGADPELVRTWNVFADIIEECRLSIGYISMGSRGKLFNYTNDALMAAISCFLVGSIPSSEDCVQVGDIDRSLYLDKKVIMILGANEGCFPAEPPDDSFLGDTERQAIKDAGGRTSYNSLERTLLLQFNVYSKMLAASEKLYVSYSLSDETGNELSRAAALDSVERLFEEVGKTERLLSFEDDNQSGPVTEADEVLLGPNLVRQLLNIKASFQGGVTSLDTYRNCPYQYFSEKVLGLEERRDGSIKSDVLGTFMHNVFEKAVNNATGEKRDFREITAGDWNRYVSDAVNAIISSTDASEMIYLSELTNKNKFYLDRAERSSVAELKDISRNLEEGYNPKASELKYGFGGQDDLPALEVDIPGSQVRLKLVGSIDRLDIADNGDGKVAIALIDYKSGKDSSDPGMGKLQLPVYYKAVEKGIDYLKKRFNFTDAEIKKLAYYHYGPDTVSDSKSTMHNEKSVIPQNILVETMEKAKKVEKGKKFETLGEYADRGLELVSETAADLVGGRFTAVYENNKACVYCRYSFMCRQKYSAQAEQSTGFDGED